MEVLTNKHAKNWRSDSFFLPVPFLDADRERSHLDSNHTIRSYGELEPSSLIHLISARRPNSQFRPLVHSWKKKNWRLRKKNWRLIYKTLAFFRGESVKMTCILQVAERGGQRVLSYSRVKIKARSVFKKRYDSRSLHISVGSTGYTN